MKVDTLLHDLVQEFLESIEVAGSTRLVYKKILGYYVSWLVKEGREVRNQRTSDIVTFKTSLIRSGRSVATIDCYVAAIKKFSSWLFEMEYTETDIAKSIKWERNRSGIFIKSSLTLDQVFQMLDTFKEKRAADKRNYAIVNLMSFTGLRCIEVTRLNVGDLKKAAGRKFLQIQRKGANEKGGLIVVPDDIVNPIKEYWRYRSGDLQDEDPMFVNHSHRSNDTRLTPAYISRIVKAALIRIGLNNKKFTAHSLRHTAATLAFLAGSERWEIGRMLGHKTPRQTEHYIHCLGIESADEGRAILKIGEYVSKQKEMQ